MHSEREKQTPVLNRFDWNKLKGSKDAEVCLFRVFSSIGSINGSKQWFESQGFETRLKSAEAGAPLAPLSDKTLGQHINAYWSVHKCGERFGTSSRWGKLINYLSFGSPGYHTLSASAGFTTDGEVTVVGVGFIVE